MVSLNIGSEPGAVRVIYSDRYNISFFGLERLHPFDSRKYGRAWALLREEFGPRLAQYHVPVDRPASDEELLLVHSATYLARYRSAIEISCALEMPVFRFVPGWLLRWRVLRPMRWAVRGSVLAARTALEHGVAVNLSGGYHHAKPELGEGFCLFADAALIVRQLRVEKLLQPTDPVAYIDLDAHQGNGVCHHFQSDRYVRIFDMFNANIYPWDDVAAQRRIDCAVPLESLCTGAEYLRQLSERLPPFLRFGPNAPTARLAIYNAGTDPFMGDQLGGLRLSRDDILARDQFVISELRKRGIPVVMLLSGGYSQESYQLVAATIIAMIRSAGN